MRKQTFIVTDKRLLRAPVRDRISIDLADVKSPAALCVGHAENGTRHDRADGLNLVGWMRGHSPRDFPTNTALGYLSTHPAEWVFDAFSEARYVNPTLTSRLEKRTKYSFVRGL